MAAKLHTAICFFLPGENKAPWKYRNIGDLESFYKFATSHGVAYVNIYFKIDKKFSHRKWLKQASN